MKTKKSKMGRPKKPVADFKGILLTVRITRGERRRLQDDAKRRKMTVSDLIMKPWRGRKTKGPKK